MLNRFFKILEVNDQKYDKNSIYKMSMQSSPFILSKKIYKNLLQDNNYIMVSSFSIIEVTHNRNNGFFIKFDCSKKHRASKDKQSFKKNINQNFEMKSKL